MDDHEFRQLNEDDDLKHLAHALIPVKGEWWEIGLVLQLQPGELRDILNDRRHNTDFQRLTAMLTIWLDKLLNPPQTWPVIVEALRSLVVNKPNIAEEIRREHCPLYPGPEEMPSRPSQAQVPGEIINGGF